MRAAICSFLGGAALASGAGAYFLRKSLYESAGDLNTTIGDLRKDVTSTNADLAARLAKLEAKVKISRPL